jgi:hypothetical protein
VAYKDFILPVNMMWGDLTHYKLDIGREMAAMGHKGASERATTAC